MRVKYTFKKFRTPDIEAELEIGPRSRVVKMVDAALIKYLRRNEPKDTGTMIANTREVAPGNVVVDTPYAHYMDRGILYVDPITLKGAFYSEDYGFWSRPNTKKIKSNRKLNYHGGSKRGAHYVRRTLTDDYDKIVADVQRKINK